MHKPEVRGENDESVVLPPALPSGRVADGDDRKQEGGDKTGLSRKQHEIPRSLEPRDGDARKKIANFKTQNKRGLESFFGIDKHVSWRTETKGRPRLHFLAY